VGTDRKIICLATPSEKLKPFLYHTGGRAENFWHLFTQDNLNHNDFVSAKRGGLINRDRRKAGDQASHKENNRLNTNVFEK
jgi:hypothetical protein